MAELKNTTINDNEAVELPTGTLAERPASPVDGYMRFNTTLNIIEIYNNGLWEYLPRIPTENLVLYLDPAEPASYLGSGTDWDDLSVDGNDAVLVNGPTYSSSNAGILNFDGNDDYGTISSSIVTTPSQLSVGGWFKKTSGGANFETVLHHGGNDSVGDSAYWFGVNPDDLVVGTIGARTNVGWDAGLTHIKVSYSKWYFVFACWDGVEVKTYVDGNLVKSYALSDYSDPGTATRIGASGDAIGYLFAGSVGPIFMYERNLGVEEVQNIFNATRRRFGL